MLLKLAAISNKLRSIASPQATLCCHIGAETVAAASRAMTGVSTHCSSASLPVPLKPTALAAPLGPHFKPSLFPLTQETHLLTMSVKTLHHSKPSTQQSPTQLALPHLLELVQEHHGPESPLSNALLRNPPAQAPA